MRTVGNAAHAAKLRVANGTLEDVIERSLLGLRDEGLRRYFVPETGARWRSLEVPSAILRSARPNHGKAVEAAASNPFLHLPDFETLLAATEVEFVRGSSSGRKTG